MSLIDIGITSGVILLALSALTALLMFGALIVSLFFSWLEFRKQEKIREGMKTQRQEWLNRVPNKKG